MSLILGNIPSGYDSLCENGWFAWSVSEVWVRLQARKFMQYLRVLHKCTTNRKMEW